MEKGRGERMNRDIDGKTQVDVCPSVSDGAVTQKL